MTRRYWLSPCRKRVKRSTILRLGKRKRRRRRSCGRLCQTPTLGRRLAETAYNLYQQQGRIFEKVAKFFQILRAERAIDHAMITAHRDRHPLADNDLVAIVDHRSFDHFADRENKALRRINDRAERIDSHAAKI